MKKLILIFFLLFSLSAMSQIITTRPAGMSFQQFGSSTTWTQINGIVYGVGGIANSVYADTAAANLTFVDQVPFAQIATSSNEVWVRNGSATAWIKYATGSTAVNIYNSDGTISGTRVVELSTYPLSFIRNTYKQLALEDDLTTIGSPNNIRRFTIYDDSIVLIGSDQSASSADSVLVRTADGRIKTRAQSAIAGATPTLQQVFDVESNVAVFTTDNEINASSHEFHVHSASSIALQVTTGVQKYIGMLDDGLMTMYVGDETTGQRVSSIIFYQDSLLVRPNQGILNIDTLRTWSGISDTTYKKVMTWDTRNGRWEYSNWFGSGGGGGVTSIGTINSQTKAANGAVITGTSLVMQTVDATYPGLMTSADKLRLDSTSYLSIDKTFDSLAWGRNDSVFLVKSLRIQANGSTITPTVTDSTLSYNLSSVATSLTNGLTLSSGVGKLGGTLTESTIINANSNDFELQSANGISLQATSVEVKNNLENYLLGIGSNGLGLYSQISADAIGSIVLRNDTIFLRPFVGNLIIDTLQSAVGTKALRYNPTTGLVSYADTTTGGGGGSSPAGNYGNVQINRNGSFATPASDSLDFNAGLSIKGSLTVSSLTSGRVPFISTSGLITDDAKLTFSAGSYPSLTIGAAGGVESSIGLRDAAGTFGYVTSQNGLSLIGSNTYNGIYLYPSAAYINRPFVSFYHNTGGPKSASFHKTVIGVDTLVGGLTDGSIQIIGSQGDSTSAATTNNGHAFRAIAKMYGNAASVNTFYSSIYMGNTNAGVTQGHGAAFQSDFFKTGSNTVDIFYHGTFLSDQILSGIVNKRYGIHFWDAHVNTGAQLGMQAFLKINKLDAATSNFDFLSDSASTAKLAGNIFLGDSTASDAGVNNSIHFFNGTAPSANISGAILYAESGELKVRNEDGVVTLLTGRTDARVATQFDATSTTTLANVTGLTANVAAGKTYRFEAKLYTTSNVAGGVKVAIAGTATATAIVYEGLTIDAGLITQSRGTALGAAVGAVTAVTAGYITISGTITVNAAGTLTVQFAQNASNGTASSVLVGSTFVITEML